MTPDELAALEGRIAGGSELILPHDLAVRVLAMARRGMAAAGRPTAEDMRVVAAARCDAEAERHEAADETEAARACRECAELIEGLDVRLVSRLLLEALLLPLPPRRSAP